MKPVAGEGPTFRGPTIRDPIFLKVWAGPHPLWSNDSTSRNWPKSKLAEMEIGRSRIGRTRKKSWLKSKLAEVDRARGEDSHAKREPNGLEEGEDATTDEEGEEGSPHEGTHNGLFFHSASHWFFMCSLSSDQYFRIVATMRPTILTTIVIVPPVRNYMNYDGHQQLDELAERIGRRELQVHVSFDVVSSHTSLKRTPFFAWPVWVQEKKKQE